MRILALTNNYPPASFGSYEMQCFQVTHALRARGHQVRVLCGRSLAQRDGLTGQNIVDRKLDFYPDSNGATSRFLTLYRASRSSVRTLQACVREFRPEVIMAWGMSGLPQSLVIEAASTGPPCVFVVYDHWLGRSAKEDPWYKYWSEDDFSEPAVLRSAIRRLHLDQAVYARAPYGDLRQVPFKHICFCSQSLKNETERRMGNDLARAKIIPCSIVPSDIRQRVGQTWTPRRLIYVARLSDEKDPLTALKAILELRRRGYDEFTLDLFGRGEPAYEAMLHEYVRRFQLGGSISFKPMNDELVRNSIHLYDALVFTSKYPEPFPLIHLKAMAARIPIISTTEGGTAELIRDGENGITFRTSHPQDLADKILYLSNDADLRTAITETAYQEAVEKFSLDKVIPRFESLLYEAASPEPREPVPA